MIRQAFRRRLDLLDYGRRRKTINVVKVKMHWDQHLRAANTAELCGFRGGHIADNVADVSLKIGATVDGQHHNVSALHPLHKSVVDTAISRVEKSYTSDLDDKSKTIVSSLFIGSQLLVSGRDRRNDRAVKSYLLVVIRLNYIIHTYAVGSDSVGNGRGDDYFAFLFTLAIAPSVQGSAWSKCAWEQKI